LVCICSLAQNGFDKNQNQIISNAPPVTIQYASNKTKQHNKHHTRRLNHHSKEENVTGNIDQEVTLKFGKKAVIKGEKLWIKFQSVLDDSRCPKGENLACSWAGEAVIVISVRKANGNWSKLELTTNPVLKDRSKVVTYKQYRIELKRVDPYPEDGKEIKTNDYKASFIVQKD
jgi:hypothetical protein